MKPLITPEQIENAKILKESWKHPDIPWKQWKSNEIERAYIQNNEFHKVPPFKSFVDSCDWIYKRELGEEMDVLDAGCSNGLYRWVLAAGGFANWSYTGLDYSPAFQIHAKRVNPGCHVDVGDILDMPYSNKTFKIVVMSIINLHVDDWKQAVREAFRVARKYIIFHRFPLWDNPTQMFEVEHYGVKMIHTFFNRNEFIDEINSYTTGAFKEFPIYETDQSTIAIAVD